MSINRESRTSVENEELLPCNCIEIISYFKISVREIRPLGAGMVSPGIQMNKKNNKYLPGFG